MKTNTHVSYYVAKFGIWVFFSTIFGENSNFYQNVIRITGTLHEDQYTCLL